MTRKQLQRATAVVLAMGMMVMTGCNSAANSVTASASQEAGGAQTAANGTEAGGADVTDAEFKLIAAHVSTETHSFHLGLEEFKKQVEEKSGGRIEVEVHANGELGGNEDELVQKMATGTVDIIISAPSFMAQSVKAADLLSLPYLFSGVEHWEAVMDGNPGQEISRLVEEQSGLFKVLGYFKDGIRNMYTIKPVETLEDMKDMKFRIQNSPTQIAFWSELGVQPTFIAFNEIYQALQNGVIDGAENSYAQIAQQKHYEVCKNITQTEHDVATRFFLISQQKYNELPEDLQAVVDEAAVLAVEKQRAVDLELDAKYKDEMEKAGVTFIAIDKEPLIEMTDEVRRKAADEMGLGAMLDEILSLK
ncbi:MAG: TRAP transporter substrate-binding protein [Lachnospiraceae bacterium]|nr:TRAP transporter substrate-binding protein [Lachnospiraceae bacterium]